MDELNRILPPELESALKEYYTAPEPASDFSARLGLELRHHYSDTPDFSRNNKGLFMRLLRTRPALAILLVIFALMILSGAVYAIGRLSGYIPGFGFASGDPYILDVPIEDNQNGVTVKVEQAVHDGSGLWVEVTADRLPDGEQFSQAYILLQDGEKVPPLRGNATGVEDGAWRLTYVFPVLDDPRQPVTLFLKDLGGQTFQITFALHPATTNEVLPVFSESMLPVQGEIQDHMALVLDHVAISADRTVLQVSLYFDQPNITLSSPWGVMLTDDQGRVYPLTEISPATMDIGVTRLYQTVPLQGNERLILKLVSFPPEQTLTMLMDFSINPATFTFDPGAHPQVGQTWTLDETLQVGPFDVHLVRAHMTSATDLIFEFDQPQNVAGVILYSTLASGASSDLSSKDGHFTAGMTFASVPSVPFEIQLMSVYYTARGPWDLEWRASAVPASKFPTMTPAPSPTALVIPTLTSRNPLLLEVQALARRFDQSVLQGPAWVHVVYENIKENIPAGQTYPPPYYQDEQWYEIDAAGWVIRNVTTHRAVNGNIIQQSASTGTKSINFTIGDVFENSPYRLSFDFLTRDLDSALQRSQPVLREETVCEDGSGCLLITIGEQFSPPIKNPGQLVAFLGRVTRVWIDLETGQQVKIQSSWQLEDGTEQADHTQRVLLIEKVAAPPEPVLEILDRIVTP